jgi:hypothetical protein
MQNVSTAFRKLLTTLFLLRFFACIITESTRTPEPTYGDHQRKQFPSHRFGRKFQ